MSWSPAAAAGLAVLFIASPARAGVCVEAQVRTTGARPSRTVVETMTREAAAIWARYGLRIQWIGADDSAACGPVRASFDVRVADGTTPRSTARPLTLGSTPARLLGSRHSPIFLDYAALDRLVKVLTFDQLVHVLGHGEATAADIGRALGRVLAHEIGHVVLAAPSHQRHGLMRATFYPVELVDYRRRAYTLSDAEVARLRDRERVLAVGSAAATDD
jgi:hypothetical protein